MLFRSTAEGRAALIARTPIHLTRRAGPVRSAEKKSRGDSDFGYDELLFEKLRQLRRRLADERNVPPYIVFSDVSLRHMAHEYPVNREAFSRITGVGERKLADYGSSFIEEIEAHLKSNARQVFADDSFA